MSFLDKIKNIVNVDEDGYYPDDDVDTGAFINSDNFKDVSNFAPAGELDTSKNEILIDVKKDVKGNDVIVHTPVVNYTKVSSTYTTKPETKQWVTESIYAKKDKTGKTYNNIATIVLGKQFTLEIPHSGQHKNESEFDGYGNSTYNYNGLNGNKYGNEAVFANSPNSFAREIEVRFSFGVIKDGKYIKKIAVLETAKEMEIPTDFLEQITI